MALAACGAPPAVSPEPEPPEPPPAELDPGAPATAQAPEDIAQQPIMAGSLQAKLPNGLTTMLLAFRPSATRTAAHTAEISLAIVAGTRMGKQGTADLAAGLLAFHGDVTTGRPPLATAIKDMGGTLHVELGPLSTWFMLRVPGPQWQRALEALAKALREPFLGRRQLQRVQRQLLRHKADLIARDPAAEISTRLLLGDRGTAEHLLTLQERTPGEAVQFQLRNYRPDRCMLVVQVPANPLQIATTVKQNFDGWNPPDIGTPDEDSRDRVMQSGLYWAPRPSGSQLPDGASRVLLVLALPDPLLPDAALQHLLLNCLTMDGIGARLERLQFDAGLYSLAWQPRFVSCAESTALVLEGITTAEGAARMWDVLSAARESLRDLPPRDGELAIARGGAWLSLFRGDLGDGTELRMRATRILRGVTEKQMTKRLEALDQVAAIDAEAIDTFTALPAAMVVIGGRPPARLAEAQSFEVFPMEFAARQPEAASDKLFSAAEPWLASAAQSVGGVDTMQQMLGFSSICTISTKDAPALEETVEWTIDSALARSRTLLGSTIDTTIAGDRWVESMDDQQMELSPLEANWRLAEVERHPLALLIAHSHGKLKFRLLATRKFEGRNHVLLEAVAERYERLRIQLDRESGLIRVVEAWTTSPGGSSTYTVDRWSDYRTVDAIRAPFRRVTIVDDGRSRRVTTYSKVAPIWTN